MNASAISGGVKLSCWVVTDGKAGVEGQCLGLADAMGLSPTIKRIALHEPWRWLPPALIPNALARLGPESSPLDPPWPELLISSGRSSAAIAIAIRRASGETTFTIHIQDPYVNPTRFDVVVVPRHDRLKGSNVIETTGGLNRITPERLAEAERRHAPQFADLPRPRIAVLLGGDSRAYRMSDSCLRRLGAELAALARREGAAILVTPSRRTAPTAVTLIRQSLAGLPVHIWDGQGMNPYLAYLALADAIVVTADSVNMISEAATTGKPVFVAALEGGSAKFARFHAEMRDAGITRPFTGHFETWTYTPLAETARVAKEITHRLYARVAASRPPCVSD